eukprot:6204729-Pleurochrysis_carterae.AAC.3
MSKTFSKLAQCLRVAKHLSREQVWAMPSSSHVHSFSRAAASIAFTSPGVHPTEPPNHVPDTKLVLGNVNTTQRQSSCLTSPHVGNDLY